MGHLAYYPLTNELIYHGQYQFAFYGDRSHYPGLTYNQMVELRSQIMDYINGSIDYLLRYELPTSISSHGTPRPKLEDVMIERCDRTEIGTPHSLLLSFSVDQEPSNSFIREFENVLRHRLRDDGPERLYYSLHGLHFYILIE